MPITLQLKNYANIKSLRHTPEILLYVNYTSMKKKRRKKRHGGGGREEKEVLVLRLY